MDAETGLSLKELSALLTENASNIASTLNNLTRLRNTVQLTENPTDKQISIWYNRVRDFKFSLSGIKYRLEEAENGLKGVPGVREQEDIGNALDIYLTLNGDGQRVNILHSRGGTGVDTTRGTTTKGSTVRSAASKNGIAKDAIFEDVIGEGGVMITDSATTRTGSTIGVATTKDVTCEAATFRDVTTQETKGGLLQTLAQQKNLARSIEHGISQLEKDIWSKRRPPT